MGNACDLDDDNDGVPDAEDCAPLDDSASALPQEAQNLTLTDNGSTQLSWTDMAPAFVYDIAGGLMSELMSEAGTTSAGCLINDVDTSDWSDPRDDPAVEDGYYYMIRAQNVCGAGPYGFETGGGERQPAAACP
jgi:hypothetical protein